MELDHEFTVPVPVDQAWSVLLDVERVAACMPGATLDSVDGEEYSGRMKVKVGAMTITYRGTARIVSADEAGRAVTMEAAAKEARGSGTASATVQARLHAEDGTTRVTVHTKLNVTGRPAQFGRNILSEVGSKIIARFAKALAAELESSGGPAGAAEAPAAAPAPAPAAEAPAKPVAVPDPEPEAPAEPADKPGPVKATEEAAARAEAAVPAAAPERPARRPLHVADEEDAIDLLEVAGPSVAKRAVPAVGGLVALLLVVRFLVRRRRRKS
ncbi:SRPBCC family protein [Actinomadura sp. NAK00032]|uniref:SRPBCC family protein n=1 Tax=Actinomadura sp. NAK00032 TaxID=2742128 RepID=UPI00158FBF39|nr:SRPBCC family protein [Actinomadura sp. NAK00032]QKW39208.1 SRPBCC family protein [Actinomadura sp. NAK00032]